MQEYLTHKDWEKIKEQLTGADQQYMNCVQCSDTKQRLNIGRRDNVLLALCFNCGVRGSSKLTYLDTFAGSVSAQGTAREPTSASGKSTHTVQSLTDYIRGCDAVPGFVRAWLLQYVPNQWIESSELVYDARAQRLVFPIRHSSSRSWKSDVIAVQRRSFGGGTKYDTMKPPGETLCSVLYADLGAQVVVFTEDWLSAVRIQLLGFNAVCCFGTTIRAIERCLDLGSKAYVWLDNDNAEVRAKQRNMHKQLSLWYDTTIIRTTDPKRCTDKQILDTLSNV